LKPTDISNPEYFHKVVDCQFACPAHTPVPEYIRLIAQQRYSDAYMVNWESNVFPGVLGRTCDRPCEPACRRGRIEEEPVAICRLKRVAADYKDDVKDRMPKIPSDKNGKRIAMIGAGPASLAVARDLMPLGYDIDLFDENPKAGGFMRSQIPSFRLPERVLDEEVGYILDMGVIQHFNTRVESLKEVLDKEYDAVFVGTGAPQGRDLDVPGRQECDANVHIGIDWLSNVAFEHIEKVGKKVVVLGGGNTAMDCCRTARRIGGEEVTISVRSTFEAMKASPWEKEDAAREGIPFECNTTPREFLHKDGKLVGIRLDRVESVYDENGKRTLKPTGEILDIECDDIICAVGQVGAFPWIEKNIGIDFDKWGMAVVNRTTYQSSRKDVFFGGDAAFGPENIITAVAHGHQVAVSIDLFCNGKSIENDRPAPGVIAFGQKMGIHQWSYDSAVETDLRYAVPHLDNKVALADRKAEVEMGYDQELAFKEAERCLNCDVQTVFTEAKCIECDACMDICPTDCINFIETAEEDALRSNLIVPAKNLAQDLYVSDSLKTGRVMVKDEDVCLHCGLCAERCPTAAWDMEKFIYTVTKAGQAA
jgi:formate dehydrogenase beta subunit|tara:strand:- start:49724 stop:51502 length:1779 start_codon:yes stop_codon:yes gene_type:complete